MPNRYFIAIVLAFGLSGLLEAQSQFGNQKVQAGSTCPPVAQPLSGDGTLYTCTGTGALYTWTGAAWVAAGGGGGTPANPTTSVQFNNAGSFGGSASLEWTGSNLVNLLGYYQGTSTATASVVNFNGYTGNDHLLATNYLVNTMTTPNASAYVAYGNFNAASSEYITVDPTIDDPTYNVYQGRLVQMNIPSTNTKLIYEVTGLSVNVTTAGTSPNAIPIAVQGITTLASATNNFTYGGYFMSEIKANTSSAVGNSNYVRAFGTATISTYAAANYGIVSAFDTAHITEGYGYYASVAKGGSGVIDHYYGLWVPAMTNVPTLGYSFWHDAQGVYRIREDNTFDSVYQGITALYNPLFTKYTAGATNFERIVQQFETNVATIRTEAGGTGTLRSIALGGATIKLLNPTIVTEAVGSSGLTLTGATQTSSFPVLNMTQTWNNSGTTFTAVKLNVTNTNSAAASLLADFQVGASPQAQITKGGSVIGGIATGGSASAVAIGAAGANRGLWSSGGSQVDISSGGTTMMTWAGGTSVLIPSDMPLGFGPNAASGNSVGSTISAAFYRDAAQVIAQRNSTNAQAFRVYNTFSSSTSYERLELDWITTSNVILIGAQKGSGGGTARVMSLVYGGTSTAAISIPITSGDITFGGVLAPTGYKSSDGSAGITGSTCSAWKNGLCTSS